MNHTNHQCEHCAFVAALMTMMPTVQAMLISALRRGFITWGLA